MEFTMNDVNHDRLKGKIEMDEDWREGMNAFRKWCTDEIDRLNLEIKKIKEGKLGD